MPWCEGCSRFLNPNTLRADGTCPTCDRKVAEPAEVAAAATPQRVPWHFKLLVALAVIYLTWRLVQMTEWLIHWLMN
jgi:hypothetical protein